MTYAEKRIAYLHMSALIGNVADKLREYADNPVVVELSVTDSNASAFREMANTLEQESAKWVAIHHSMATMDKDRPRL